MTNNPRRAAEKVRVVIAAPLAQEFCDRIANVDPRVEMVVDHSILAPSRHPADWEGDPDFQRSADDQARFDALVDSADVLFSMPDDRPDALARTVAANPGLRWVQLMAAGAGSQVLAAQLPAEALGRIVFTSAAGVHEIPLAEWALFGMLAGAKDLTRLQRQQRAHDWPSQRVPTHSLHGGTVLILGLGGIGQGLASRCQGLGLKVLGVKRTPSRVAGVDEVHSLADVPELVGRADFIVNALPGTRGTDGLFDAALFERVKPGATFVNVGRGSVVDEAALLAALADGRIGFAALDVVAREPLPPDSPLWDAENVLISPHAAAYDPAEEERITDLFCDNLRAFLDGRPLRNVIDVEQGY